LPAALTKREEYERVRRHRAKFAAGNGYYVERIASLKELDETGKALENCLREIVISTNSTLMKRDSAILRACEGIGDQLEHRASFEASLREAPQDEEIS
jgi:hypothetical protein